MKWRRVISLVTLTIAIIMLVFALKRPAPVATEVAPVAAAAAAQSFQEKVNQLSQPKSPGASESEIRISSGELSAGLDQATGRVPPATSVASTAAPAAPLTAAPATELPGPVPNIKDYHVSMEGDILRGQFLTQIAGKDVYLTLAGHLGSKGGYATFEATEAKIGDLTVPASLVNEVLQKKLMEQRDQLKLPDNVKDIKVENGELVFVDR